MSITTQIEIIVACDFCGARALEEHAYQWRPVKLANGAEGHRCHRYGCVKKAMEQKAKKGGANG